MTPSLLLWLLARARQDDSNESASIAELLATQTASDHAAVDRLFANRRCRHAYLDVGTNIGVQLRKLAEPDKYPGAPALALFREAFGPPPWCDVCAIGLEPNPRHLARLNTLETRLRDANAEVLILRAAASTAASTATFQADGGSIPWVRGKWVRRSHKLGLASSIVTAGSGADGRGQVVVRTIDLAALVHRVHRNLQRNNGGQRRTSRLLLKLDVEGAEYTVLPHLVMQHALCLIDTIFTEWHAPTDKPAPAIERRDAALDDPTSAGIDLAGAFRTQLRALTSGNATAADCRTRVSHVDDETYWQDGRPWSKPGSLCPANSSTLPAASHATDTPATPATPEPFPWTKAYTRAGANKVYAVLYRPRLAFWVKSKQSGATIGGNCTCGSARGQITLDLSRGDKEKCNRGTAPRAAGNGTHSPPCRRWHTHEQCESTESRCVHWHTHALRCELDRPCHPRAGLASDGEAPTVLRLELRGGGLAIPLTYLDGRGPEMVLCSHRLQEGLHPPVIAAWHAHYFGLGVRDFWMYSSELSAAPPAVAALPGVQFISLASHAPVPSSALPPGGWQFNQILANYDCWARSRAVGARWTFLLDLDELLLAPKRWWEAFEPQATGLHGVSLPMHTIQSGAIDAGATAAQIASACRRPAPGPAVSTPSSGPWWWAHPCTSHTWHGSRKYMVGRDGWPNEIHRLGGPECRLHQDGSLVLLHARGLTASRTSADKWLRALPVCMAAATSNASDELRVCDGSGEQHAGYTRASLVSEMRRDAGSADAGACQSAMRRWSRPA